MQEEKGTTEDEMVGWHHRLNGHEFEQLLGDSEGKPGMIQPMGSQIAELDCVTKQRQCSYCHFLNCLGFVSVGFFFLLCFLSI